MTIGHRARQRRHQRLTINGRFLAAPATGVQRVAAELVGALLRDPKRLASIFRQGAAILGPRDAPARFDEPATPIAHGRLRGHAWEQFELPLAGRDSLLLNLCNLAPVLTKRSVVMIHDAQAFSSPASYSRAFALAYQTALPRLGHTAARTLTVSAYSARELTQYRIAPADRITVIPNGVDHVLRTPADTAVLARLGLSHQGYVVAPGSLHAHKNVQLLVDAFCSDTLRSVTLVLFGGSDVRAALLGDRPIPPNILWAGRVSDGELRALNESALCFAFPSRTEGFGLPPLEAMLLGCPAIVTTGGALPEVCDDAAFYASADDAREWISLIDHLRTDADLRQRYADRGVRRARTFTWDRAAGALFSVLDEVNGG